LGLKTHHPELFRAAMKYEKFGYTWIQGGTLAELVSKVEMFGEIENLEPKDRKNWQEQLRADTNSQDDSRACIICSL
jgi:gluconate kinase